MVLRYVKWFTVTANDSRRDRKKYKHEMEKPKARDMEQPTMQWSSQPRFQALSLPCLTCRWEKDPNENDKGGRGERAWERGCSLVTSMTVKFGAKIPHVLCAFLISFIPTYTGIGLACFYFYIFADGIFSQYKAYTDIAQRMLLFSLI